MSDQREDQERPCLHCMMVELSTISSPNTPQQQAQTKSIPMKQMK